MILHPQCDVYGLGWKSVHSVTHIAVKNKREEKHKQQIVNVTQLRMLELKGGQVTLGAN